MRVAAAAAPAAAGVRVLGGGVARVPPRPWALRGRRRLSVRMSVVTTEAASAAAAVGASEDQVLEARNAKTVVAVILGGGAGTRLFPLTKRRAKPAVPIGGAYRLIDVPMSNCINSGINKVYILTQFNSASLNRHLSRAYDFSNGVAFGDGFVEVLAATQRPGSEGKRWFQGTADAVRQFDWLFDDAKAKDIEDVLILSGDHLYRMDYMDFVQSHRQRGAGISICCLPIDGSRASDFGLMKIDDTGRVISFSEKPKGDELKAMVRWRFPTANDFGSEIIPASAKEINVKAYLFNDYWEDIGTIKSFFEANLALAEQPSRFSFYDADKPMYTSRRNLPPSMVNNSKITDSIISHGCFLDNCSIDHSVIGIRSRIGPNVHLKDTVMLGADYYETDVERGEQLAEGKVPIGIGENTTIQKCIIDKNARIGKNVTISNSEGVEEADRTSEGFYIRSGITIVLKNSTIADGLVI
ncbi:Glucose-1-phosphate adenylyltransferase large subunit 3, chloroplastic/amyloplastic [Dichanthelium oligosanthes]|uniref:glucose-1-phosphate adenylyltransferase n=1 Tax=Dichanthelium oligosanthes TaxID=888268 RepID=A0A1E5VL63_9POAL|nr:Glucose-1-phosphate adenylyltransferase large subunit 3, chloroplastic/amyloplastic [Dichanthelium oligosanthes]